MIHCGVVGRATSSDDCRFAGGGADDRPSSELAGSTILDPFLFARASIIFFRGPNGSPSP